MNQILGEILLTVVSGVVTVVGGFASHCFYKKGHKAAAEKTLAETQKVKNEIDNNQVLAENAVRFVEKRFGGESAVVKFDKAAQALIDSANGHGISISKDAALPLIEGALKKLEDEVGASWSNSQSTKVITDQPTAVQ